MSRPALDPQRLVAPAALAIGAAAFLVCMLAMDVRGLSHAGKAALVGATSGAAAFLVLRFVLLRLVQDRIRGILKVVQGLRGAADPVVVPARTDDALGRVEGEVAEWARARRSEITELRERERFRREFIGNLAHELKTPIFNIQGYILTLLDGGLEDPKVNRDFLTRAGHGVDRLIKIVEDLDLITRLESGVMDLREQPHALRGLVEEAAREVELAARDKGIALVDRVPEGLVVHGDRDRLVQVFVNLFVNAVSYGRRDGHCTVSVEDMGEHVLVEVSDDGIGIGEEHLPRLFERFYRVGTSRARNEGGSGLGLAIVKHIVEAHGQTITVRSTEGRGSTFAFTLRKSR
ncbi:MAG: sensor histidine kinase [Flavobacteriales bacterium]|nr:Adaptive-response sensory-kinase SasA [Flavobacteriales bacterium]MCC6577948.1 sensor histidine kinase [Flavobacteriales bacterium]NUQ14416.1 sensor histidine kinase [Flavobacteriales bacterium]